jgi:hypothetical protein
MFLTIFVINLLKLRYFNLKLLLVFLNYIDFYEKSTYFTRYKVKHIYKLKKDNEDLRDFAYTSVKFKKLLELPKKIDLRTSCSPVVNQGNLSSYIQMPLSQV